MSTPTAKARAFIAWLDDLREATDLLAAGLRGPLHKLTLSLISFQGTFAAAKAIGMLGPILAAHPRFAHAVDSAGVWVGLSSTIIALYTQRKGEAAALLETKRRETAASVAVVQSGATPASERHDP